MAAVGQVCENIQMLLEAAEFLERREREAEHGYASLLPFSAKEREAFKRRSRPKKGGGGGGGSRSTHNEMEKNRRAHLRLCLEKLKGMVPLGPESSRHTTLSLLTKAKLHIKKLEDYDRKAIHQIDQLQREQRHLKRQLEKLGIERVRMDSLGSTVSSERSDSDRGEEEALMGARVRASKFQHELLGQKALLGLLTCLHFTFPSLPAPPSLPPSLPRRPLGWLTWLSVAEEIDVDVESTDYLTGDLDWSSSSSSPPSDSDERGSLQSVCSDEGYSSAGIQRIKPQNHLKACLSL
uniref:MAX dimerization protein 1 n=1 Tax=Naja naja TaxID=35670 RepID=A0A8C6VT36_NAJNA